MLSSTPGLHLGEASRVIQLRTKMFPNVLSVATRSKSFLVTISRLFFWPRLPHIPLSGFLSLTAIPLATPPLGPLHFLFWLPAMSFFIQCAAPFLPSPLTLLIIHTPVQPSLPWDRAPGPQVRLEALVLTLTSPLLETALCSVAD